MRSKPVFIDLFAVPGGLSLGCEMAGFRCVGAVDIDKAGMDTYRHNFPNTQVILGDIRKLETRTLMKTFDLSVGELDLLVGGPPCQGFSTIGRVKIASLVKNGKWNLSIPVPRFIDDPRNILYREFIRIVRELRPKTVIMENVSGMLSYRNGEIVRQIIDDFKDAGYRADAKVLDAADYGVPQHRKRIFFIANRLGKPNIFPAPTHADLDSFTLNDGVRKTVTVWDAIGDLPELCAGEGEEVSGYTNPPFTDYQKIMRYGADKLYNHVARPHSERDIKCFTSMKEGMIWRDLPTDIKQLFKFRDDVFHDKIRRMRKDRPSWTIVSHLYKDGYMFIHPEQPRTITVREAARLQSFPDRFRFVGSRTNQFKQVGNAVPPFLARAVAEYVKQTILMADEGKD